MRMRSLPPRILVEAGIPSGITKHWEMALNSTRKASGWRVFLFISIVLALSLPMGIASEPVTVLTGLGAEQIERFAADLEKQGLSVQFEVIIDEAIIPGIVRSPREDLPKPDLLYGVSTIVLSHLADQGFLKPCEPAWEGSLPVGLSDRDGRWFGVFGDPITIVYNYSYFDEDLPVRFLPEGWEDLGSRTFREALLIERPNPFNVTGYLFASIVDRAEQLYKDSEKGFDLLADIDRNLFHTYADTTSLFESPGSLFSGGQGVISMACIRDIERCIKDGKTAEIVMPVEGLFLYPRGIGLLKDAPEEAVAVYKALTDESRLMRLSANANCYPLIFEKNYACTLRPGQKVFFEIFPTDHDSLQRNISTWINRWQNTIHGKAQERETAIDDAINTAMTFLIPVFIVIIIITSRRKDSKKKAK